MSFDGVRVTVRPGVWTIDGFAIRPVNTTTGIFDDPPDHTRVFWGVYASRPTHWWSGSHVDLYYLGLARKVARFNQGVGREVRHTLGGRLWGQTESWTYDGEAIYQTGTFGSGVISTWRVASDTTYKFHAPRWSPRLGLKADVASGDRDPKNPDLQTFNALFQSGLYTGKAGILGPSNTIDLEPSFGFRLSRSVSVTSGWGFYWRQSLGDGLYDIPGNLVMWLCGSRTNFDAWPILQTLVGKPQTARTLNWAFVAGDCFYGKLSAKRIDSAKDFVGDVRVEAAGPSW